MSKVNCPENISENDRRRQLTALIDDIAAHPDNYTEMEMWQVRAELDAMKSGYWQAKDWTGK